MNQIKSLVKKYFSSFAYYYKYLGYRIFIVMALSILIAFLDGLGLTMFMPLLQMADKNSVASGEGLGNMGFVIDGINSLGISLNLTNILIFLFLFFSLKGIIIYISSIYKVKYAQYFIKSLRVKLINLLRIYSFKSFVKADVGRIQNSMTGEIGRVATSYRYYSDCILQLIMVMVYMFFVFAVDWRFALLVCVGGLFSNILFKNLFKNTKLQSVKLTKNNNLYQGQIIQFISNFKYLKSTGLISKYINKLIDSISDIEQNNTKIGFLNARISALREPIMIGIVCIVIIIQVNYFNGALTSIFFSLLLFYRALAALMLFQNKYNSFLALTGSLDNITTFESELKHGKERTGKLKFDHLKSSIKADKISFGYTESNGILDNLSLIVNKNDTVAFVGESGSGKTTLVNLLCGLLKSNSGKILINDVDVKQYHLSSYQKRIGYISQDPVIFNDTIFNNVTFWQKPTTENILKFEKALEQASILEYVSSLPNNKDTLLGNNGINLSGGQKQRISIARELYKEIDILILDEATSALDSETEKEIQDNIDTLKGKYTIIIIAHRLSTIKNADKIFLMDKGKIIGEGNFKELVQNSDRFRKMVELQEI